MPDPIYSQTRDGSVRVLFTRVEPLFNRRPVHHVPPGSQVVGTAVLIFQIVGVLPHIDPHHRELAFHNRAILVGGGDDIELAGAILYKTSPTGAEARGPR